MIVALFAGMMAMLSPAQNRLPPPRMEIRMPLVAPVPEDETAKAMARLEKIKGNKRRGA